VKCFAHIKTFGLASFGIVMSPGRDAGAHDMLRNSEAFGLAPGPKRPGLASRLNLDDHAILGPVVNRLGRLQIQDDAAVRGGSPEDVRP